MNNDELYLSIFKENLLHLRHQETQRMWIANIFMATVAGVVAYLTKSEDSISITWYVPCAFLIISTICLLVTLKLNDVFNAAKKSAIKIFDDKKVSLDVADWLQYVGMLKSTSQFGRIFKVRHLYVALYLIAITVSLIWLCIVLKDCWFWVLISIGILVVVLIIIYPKSIWAKFKKLLLCAVSLLKFITHEYRKNS